MAKRIVADSFSGPNEADLLLHPDLLPPGSLRPRPAHQARTFAQLPGRDEAAALLAELADAPCAFAPVAADKPLALYGAGDMGRLARDFVALAGLDVVLVIDQHAGRAGVGAWSAMRPVTPDAVPEETRRAVRVAVCVATAAYVPIEKALHAAGFADVVPFYDLAESFRHLHPLSNGWFAPPFTALEQVDVAAVLAGWGDDTSRVHHLQFLAWRRLREEWTFTSAPPLPNSERFFIPEIMTALRGDEVFVDAGAYHGDVAMAFVGATAGKFRQIVAIEPDPESRARLHEKMQKVLPGDARVTILDMALGAEGGEAPFHDGLGYASQLSRTGDLKVQVRSLDALGIAPTFLKLHLEGGELAALQGAKQTLIDNRSLVAATVYHNADGIWRTAQWLMRTLANYRFLFRLHSWCGTGAVIYAIPNERSPR